MDNLGSQKELEVIHSHLFEILGHIFQKYRSGADSTRHIRAGLSRGLSCRVHRAGSSRGFVTQVLPPGSSAAARIRRQGGKPGVI
ncbi:hypothetical protein [uncultured Rothia sp.]|uniref:hypothetical protein n=1 Tax=uncultured Rothia sp. TaxID=316088 RepID=UPI0028DB067E|nr:hypothetical protein [uncultured Rothia sp.]